MKHPLLILTLLLLAILPASAVKKIDIHPVKNIEANPINVAAILTEQPDTASIAEACEYYGYERQQPNQDYTVFTHPNGSTIRYKVSDSGTSYPIIEVKSNASARQKTQILQDLNFQKAANCYERRSIGYITRCSNGNQGFLRFTSHPKETKP
ncbi:MAG: hypothetical protein HDP34_00705 [Clostridia bacterium]|nr:hypothetical protein [Clostridia bacterium]